MLPELKQQEEYQWLSEVASVPLQQTLRHLEKAFLNFFEGRGKYPTFTICVESLVVKNMVKNHSLAKAISDVGWSEFVSQLEYKAAWYGRNLVKIDKWYPSSKRCFDCGHILETLSLDVRIWTCPECGGVHDRDLNAAKNIRSVGLTALNACGEAVRPGRALSRSGKPR